MCEPITWKAFKVQQIFKEGRTFFIFKGEILLMGEEVVQINQTPKDGSISDIAGAILDLLVEKNLLTGKEEVSHRIACEPNNAPLEMGTVVTVTIKTIKGKERNGKECSATIDTQDPIKGYLFALTGAFSKFLSQAQSPLQV